MSATQRQKVAEQYVSQQLTTMRESGMIVEDVSEDEYRALVEEIEEAIDLK